MTRVVDALCHLDDVRVGDPSALLHDAAAAGVTDVVVGGVDPRRTLVVPASNALRVHRCVGFHPRAIDEVNHTLQLRGLARAVDDGGVIALGEIGLDGREGSPPRALQIAVLEQVLAIAQAARLPAIFHVVKAMEPFLDVIKRFPAVTGVVHGFSGSPETAHALIARGLLVSFDGLVTHARHRRCRASAAAIPLSSLVVESDAPDHAPLGVVAHGPASVVAVAHAIAGLRDDDPEEVLFRSGANAVALFRL